MMISRHLKMLHDGIAAILSHESCETIALEIALLINLWVEGFPEESRADALEAFFEATRTMIQPKEVKQ